jgi:ElaB/YqjD/DUF883 family membrane-anchored ribosome-binding protein
MKSSKRINVHPLTTDWLKIRNAFADTADNVKHKAEAALNDSLDSVKSTSSKVHDDVSTYTAKQPIKSLGIALAVGVALGFIIRR